MIAKIVKFLNEYIALYILKIRRKPRVIQLPITGKCNSRCIICNIWQKKDKRDIDVKALEKALQDNFFSEVNAVGVNGGEPFLHNDIVGVIEAVLSLKKLKTIYIITNGLAKVRIVESVKAISELCRKRGVVLDITVSVDAVGEVNDKIRGIAGSYDKSVETLNELSNIQYVHVAAGCTICRDNVYNIAQLEETFRELNIPAHYHLGVPIKRIDTFESNQEVYIFNDKRSEMLAREMFFAQFKYPTDFKNGLRAFMSYYYLASKHKERLATCTYLRQDVTIDEYLNIYLCATASERVGSLLECSATELLIDGAMDVECKKLETKCNTCIHYATHPTLKCIYLFINEKLKPSVWVIYKLRVRLGLF